MRDSSIDVKVRKPGDCWDAPVNAIFYSGATSDVPTLELGLIHFKGGRSLMKAKGIGIDGYAGGNNVFKLKIDNIMKGGSGVKVRACTSTLAKRVRFKCCDTTDFNDFERTAIDVRHVSDCFTPVWFPYVTTKEVFFECSKMQSCCQKLNGLAAEFNTDANSPVTAEVQLIGDTYFLDLVAKKPGVDFTVVSQEGLSEPDLIVPNMRGGFTAKTMVDWFGPEQISTDPNKCFTVIEIFFIGERPYRGATGTSNPLTGNTEFKQVEDMVTVIFDDSVTASTDAKNALITLLNGSNQYQDVMAGSTAADFAIYAYCISRTDNGDDAALATTQGNYTTNRVRLDRRMYKDGKSYYTLTTTSATAPTANGSDVVTQGYCGDDNLPCSTPGNCPEVDGGCFNC